MNPPEVDLPKDVADGTVIGAKYAAIRKLDHELGIPSVQLPVEKFKFLTRLHYWAADTVTHGKDSPWGEHEIDYVLFFVVPSKNDITVTPNPEEVDAVKWVTKSKLLSMMADTNLLFSPWFRIIVKKWMLCEGGWWEDLKNTMETSVHCDYKSILRFDPPDEHMGGKGKAGPMFSSQKNVNGDTSKKQGAYGKIKVHKESKISQIMRFDEVWSAVTLLYLKPLKSNLSSAYVKQTYDASDLKFCDDILCKVSRSFAAVIRQLPPTLLVDVMIFYLVLRALDTIEDDMEAFESNAIKVKHLLNFHKSALADSTWSMDGVGEGDEKLLLQNFPKCYSVFAALKPESQRVIVDITQRMATGMAEFVDKDLGQGTVDTKQYNRYCHFVAGLVGEGLSRLFVASGLESSSLGKELHLSDQMGLFLQKTNIIRDYLEDYVDGRAFWPQSVWKKHSLSGDLGYFTDQKDKEVQRRSRMCLNELVTDALELVPDCLQYLSKLQCSEIYRFCAIPQVMAIATLEKCYDNLDVFTGVVKIRKGMSCNLINDAVDQEGVHAIFHSLAKKVTRKAELANSNGFDDPSCKRTLEICNSICALTNSAARIRRNSSQLKLFSMLGLSVALFLNHLILAAVPLFFLVSNKFKLFGLNSTLRSAQTILDKSGTRNESKKKV
mmetsp:Transcript_10817/g.15252  ORF Transcript_10817/g.15252 Transcript_10817/m.15252 type:complete len:664 (+) Transcript_10817:523-2514(+)